MESIKALFVLVSLSSCHDRPYLSGGVKTGSHPNHPSTYDEGEVPLIFLNLNKLKLKASIVKKTVKRYTDKI